MSKAVVSVDKESIKKNCEYIISEIDALELVDFLVENKAITLNDRQRIVANQSKIKRNIDLIDLILNDTTENALHFFLQSLKLKSKHVLDRLQKTDSHDQATSGAAAGGLGVLNLGAAAGVLRPMSLAMSALVTAISGVRSSPVSDQAPETEKQQRIENELRQELGQARNAIRILKEGIDKAMNETRILKEERDKAMNETRILKEERDKAMNEIRILKEERVQERAVTIEKQRQEKELQDKLVKEHEDVIEKIRQENKQLHDKLVKEHEDAIEKLRQENKQLLDKLANLSTFQIKEKYRWPEKETMEDPRRDVEYSKERLPLGQNDNTSSHQKCVPVKDFLLTHLPPCYQDVEMLSLIKSLADISVKIEVKDVDYKRKQFWDYSAQALMLHSKPIDTKTVPGVSYSEVKSASFMKPGSSSTLIDSQMDVNTSDITSSSHLLGSGKVDDVFIRTEADYGPCPCHKKCQEWGEIRVLTSAKLMYDDDDAKHFVCTFFYDDDERMDQLKSARGDRIVLRDLKKDVCMFLCVTCDVGLVRTLEGMLDKFEQSWENAFDKYANTVKWENERLTVIVFHPNGLRKHISLGKSLTPNVESSEKIIEYDNPIFKGSKGAYVLIPDFNVNDEV
ncbi:uncharacterized protein LOC106057074 isoform X3 [Biomphalaria glabrata]|uniref:Uncharacterized protein LOC106057074 isoform X2 n=1 Tax=Biomphalaria glabrata TaxID=6526 RepID=A0A9W2Z5L9_BIOGL|nr:uncharacterized protein LOC106057074 isoform X2 [Biomphalaria glabrata]XP_055870236.1 uncharacterized protein LOC106057074 isoform X3 [Biomphalaria glabrata]